MNYIKTFTQPDTSEVSLRVKPSDAMMKTTPHDGRGIWKMVRKDGHKADNRTGCAERAVLFEQRNSGSTICTLPLRRSSCLKAAQRFRVVKISSRGCFSLHFNNKIK